MPRLVHLLSLAVFAMGTSEFMLTGVLSAIADDFTISREAAGTLVSGYALGMVVGAPAAAALTRRWRPRPTLVALLIVFAAAHVAGAVATDWRVLLATRVVSALANAGFLAAAISFITATVAPDLRAKALAVILAGTTTAMIVGVPIGTALGSALGWRSTFYAVAIVCLAPIGAVARSRRHADPIAGTSERPSLADELRVLGRPTVLGTVAVTALVNAGTFGALTYLAVMATETTGLPSGWIPALLVVFGVGALAGVTTSGRFSGTRPWHLLGACCPALVAAWCAFALFGTSKPVAVALTGLIGFLAFAAGGALITLTTVAAEDAPTMSGAYATVALNLGALFGPIAAGSALRIDPVGPAWFACGTALLATAGGVLVRHRASHPEHSSFRTR